MERFVTIDEMELFKIDGGESYDMDETLIGVAGKISEWFKGLFD